MKHQLPFSCALLALTLACGTKDTRPRSEEGGVVTTTLKPDEVRRCSEVTFSPRKRGLQMRRFAAPHGADIALALYPAMFSISYDAGTVLGMTSMAMEAVPEQLSTYARAGFETFAMDDYSVHCWSEAVDSGALAPRPP